MILLLEKSLITLSKVYIWSATNISDMTKAWGQLQGINKVPTLMELFSS